MRDIHAKRVLITRWSSIRKERMIILTNDLHFIYPALTLGLEARRRVME